MRDRLACLDCKHLWLDQRDHGYSELTPSGEMYWACLKEHKPKMGQFSEYDITPEKVRSFLEMGQDCEDYEEKDDA